MKSEMEQILDQAKKISKDMKITRQEALLLMIAHNAFCIHDHIDRIIFGVLQTHAPKKPEKPEKKGR